MYSLIRAVFKICSLCFWRYFDDRIVDFPPSASLSKSFCVIPFRTITHGIVINYRLFNSVYNEMYIDFYSC